MIQKLKQLKVQEILREKGVRLFSPEEFRRIFHVKEWAARTFIKNHVGDLFVKLRNGLYALKAEPPGEFEIANRIYRPSYISFESALSHYGMIPESVYTITSATTGITREFLADGRTYSFSRIKKETYRGYRSEIHKNIAVLIAEPEKALADYLYFVDLKQTSLNERLRIRNIRIKLALHYTALFRRKSLTQLVKRVIYD